WVRRRGRRADRTRWHPTRHAGQADRLPRTDQRRTRRRDPATCQLTSSTPSASCGSSPTTASTAGSWAASAPWPTVGTDGTLDIDVVAPSTDANLERLASALRDLGGRLRVGGLTDEEARALPVTVDLPVAGGRRTDDEMV